MNQATTRPWRQLWETKAERRKLIERFWRKVTKTPKCWLWKGARQGNKRQPYGLFDYHRPGGRRLRVVAHKFAWLEIAGRELPPGTELGHTCHNALCIRPGPSATNHTQLKHYSDVAPQRHQTRDPPRQKGGRLKPHAENCLHS